MITLGSLFSGSGGFEFAGSLVGIKPIWNAEIEKFPRAVTDVRFPDVKQLGDVTQINGAEIEPVDIITFGSPCQDLSIAGKQAGIIDGSRSSLFFQAIRIIKEMRKATDNKYPKFAVWENVRGALSSNKGDDFYEVMQAFASVCEPEISIPRPKKWEKSGWMDGNGWSVAWRLYDAQYWGVPQRRKRIYCIADFRENKWGGLEKYFLSPKACQGILNRATKRGKILPPILEEALRQQSSKKGGGEKLQHSSQLYR